MGFIDISEWRVAASAHFEVELFPVEGGVEDRLDFLDVFYVLGGDETTQVRLELDFRLHLGVGPSNKVRVAVINTFPKVALFAAQVLHPVEVVLREVHHYQLLAGRPGCLGVVLLAVVL